MERAIKCLIDRCKFIFKPLKLVLILKMRFFHGRNFILQFFQVGLSSLNIFLAFKQKYLLFLVVLLDGLLEEVLPIFEHLNHQIEFFVKLLDSVFLFLLKLLFDFLQVFGEHLSLLDRDLYFILKCHLLLNYWVLLMNLLSLVANLMTLVVLDNAF